MDLTAAYVAGVTGGRLVGGEDGRRLAGVSIDSRTLAPGELFVALRGARLDGHAFVEAAIAAGACGVMVSAEEAAAVAVRHGAFAVVVPDTLDALQRLARDVRRRSGARVVAVTGSAGKTTTKEWAADLLAGRYRVARSRGNLNNHIGLPLSLLALRDEPDVAVVELAMNHPDELRTLVAIAEPDVRVWTNVGDAHLGFFASVDELARAKAEILEGAAPGTVLVANAEDPRVMAHARAFAGRVVTFGVACGDVHAAEAEDRGVDGWCLSLRTPAGQARVEVPVAGPAALRNLLAAAAVAVVLGVSVAEIADRAARLRPAPHRGEVIRLSRGVTLVDDSYNASPSAVSAALAALEAAGSTRRRVAFLGEMRELGEHAEALHRDVGRRAAECGISVLVAIGGEPAEVLAAAAVDAGLDPQAVRYVPTSEEAAALVPSIVRPGDLVLVKGSRAVATERVVERVVQEFA